MIQATLNAYGPRTVFVRKHPYRDAIEKPGPISGVSLVQIVKEHPGITSPEIFKLINKGNISKIGASLQLRVKYGDVHSKRVFTPRLNGANQILHWYPGKESNQ